jgi:hypothetical protein
MLCGRKPRHVQPQRRTVKSSRVISSKQAKPGVWPGRFTLQRALALRGLQGDGGWPACGLHANEGNRMGGRCVRLHCAGIGFDGDDGEDSGRWWCAGRRIGECAISGTRRQFVVAAIGGGIAARVSCRGIQAVAAHRNAQGSVLGHRHVSGRQHGAQHHQRQQQRNDQMQVAAGDHEGILVPEGVVVMLAQLQRPFSQE